MKVAAILIAIVLIGCFTTASNAQHSSEVKVHWPELLEFDPYTWLIRDYSIIQEGIEHKIPKARAHWKEIQETGKSGANDDWSGIYYLFGTEIVHLVFAYSPQSGFVAFITESCGGSIADVMVGKVKVKKGLIKILPELSFTSSKGWIGKFIKPNTNLVQVKWGGVKFLVPERELKAFCEEFVIGGKPYHWDGPRLVHPLISYTAAMKLEDETGAPVLPAIYTYLAKRPIVTKVKKLGRTYFRRDPGLPEHRILTGKIFLDSGTAQGVTIGTTLINLDWNFKNQQRVEIIRVARNSSIGRYEYTIPKEIFRDAKKVKAHIEEYDYLITPSTKFRTLSLWHIR